ncbi:prolipoprotein diacylglyceryl transferase [Marmoricola sp. OAE513]|uniref:prolipoprotein diacylglyceryl transferase n=1 Tax=Marmoricola sp. OAE513 TaxID=2817894 RepID=UPI001DC12D85
MIAELVPQFIPSPSEGVWHLGPVPIRAYALAIILGVFAAIWFGEKRWVARGGVAGQVGDVAIWGVPFGLVGARLYHVITDHNLYFSHSSKPEHNWDPVGALEVWHGGLGIWGAIAGGVFGGMFACRRYGIKFRPMLDALAPALLLAQAIGRFGNYFNQELFGKPLDKPWGLKIDGAHLPKQPDGSAFDVDKYFPDGPPYTFHPTFLYEALWNVGGIGLILFLDRRLKLGFGRCFALYVMVYCAGRGWIENLRIDFVEANDVFGLRLNVWTSIILFLLALAYFVVAGRKHPAPASREESVLVEGVEAADGAKADEADEKVADAAEAVPESDTPR